MNDVPNALPIPVTRLHAPCVACRELFAAALLRPDRTVRHVIHRPGIVFGYCEHKRVLLVATADFTTVQPADTQAEAERQAGAWAASNAMLDGYLAEVVARANGRSVT